MNWTVQKLTVCTYVSVCIMNWSASCDVGELQGWPSRAQNGLQVLEREIQNSTDFSQNEFQLQMLMSPYDVAH